KPPFDQGVARFYQADCAFLGEVAFGTGAWDLVLADSGATSSDAGGRRGNAVPDLATSPTACGDLGHRDRWSVTVSNGTDEPLLGRIMIGTEVRKLGLPAGASTTLVVATTPVSGNLAILDPTTCAVLAATPLLDVSSLTTISPSSGHPEISLDVVVPMDTSQE